MRHGSLATGSGRLFLAVLAAVTIVVAACDSPDPHRSPGPSPAPREPLRMISHAGGGLPPPGGDGDWLDYSNSREALDLAHARGHRLFEVDLEWTTDGELVALHDWENQFVRLYHDPPGQRSKSEFHALRSRYDLHHLDLDGIVAWLDEHPGCRVVTDIKSRNLAGLGQIRRVAGAEQQRFIPQVYNALEWRLAVDPLGYRDLIFTLYRGNIDDAALLKFVSDHRVFAVTMPLRRAETALPSRLAEFGVFVYTHTIDSEERFARLRERWEIDGVYTDELPPTASP